MARTALPTPIPESPARPVLPEVVDWAHELRAINIDLLALQSHPMALEDKYRTVQGLMLRSSLNSTAMQEGYQSLFLELREQARNMWKQHKDMATTASEALQRSGSEIQRLKEELETARQELQALRAQGAAKLTAAEGGAGDTKTLM